MSEITIRCPFCGVSLSGDSDFLGEEVGCPDCGNNFIAKAFTGYFEESESVPHSSNDSVFTDTERGVKRPAAFRHQGSVERGAKRPAALRRQAGKSASFSGSMAPSSPAMRPVPVRRRKKSFDLLIASRASGPRIFELNPWFWIFFSIGVLLFSAGIFNVLYAPGYDGEFKDWGGALIYQPNPKRKGDALVSDSAYVAAKNTVVICEGLKHINRNISNIGTHYLGMHEMVVGFAMIFGSGFFFFCALISFLYSARLPAEKE